MLHHVPAPESREEKPTSDGYQVTRDYGGLGGSTDTVHVPPRDPEAVARTRRDLNAVLARYGYHLAEPAPAEERPQETKEV